MELEYRNLEFEDKEINDLVKQLNNLFDHQQGDFSTLCYAVYKISCYFEDSPEILLKSKLNEYYTKKKLFKALGFTNKQVNRYCACYEKFMTLDDVGSKLKPLFVSFAPSKLFELLPLSYSKLEEFVLNKQITPQMTVKEIREFLKTFNEKVDIDNSLQSPISAEEDNYIILKNDTARRDFLENYKSWGLWFEEPRLKLEYYRCKIGEKILVAVNSFFPSYGGKTEECKSFYFLNDLGSMNRYMSSENEIVAVMKTVEDKKVYLF